LKSGAFLLCIEDTTHINLFNSFVEDKVVALDTEQEPDPTSRPNPVSIDITRAGFNAYRIYDFRAQGDEGYACQASTR